MPEPDHAADRETQRRKHNEKMKRYYERHPEQRRKKIDRIKERYSTDEAYRAAVKARAAERLLHLKKANECQ